MSASLVERPFFAIVNPAAGGGRCGRRAARVLSDLTAHGLRMEVVWTRRAGDARAHARAAYEAGYRQFLIIGGDGTTFEVLNGIFPAAEQATEPPHLALLPLGTGNSFLRDFTDVEEPTLLVGRVIEAVRAQRAHPCDVLRLTHREGRIYFHNLLSLGFPAEVAAVTNRWFKPLGELGYLLGVLLCLMRLPRRAFPLCAETESEPDTRRCLFVTFNNSKFTGGKMMIAPQANPSDGLIEYVRWGPIGRLGVIRTLPRLFDGSHVTHPLCERKAVRRIEFFLPEPVSVMVDGEVLRLHCERLEVLPHAVHVLV